MNHRHPAARRTRGLTLVECLCTMGVASVLTTVVAPSFEGLRQTRALVGAAAQLETDLQLARSEAVARNQPVRLMVGRAGAASCMAIHTGGAADCECGPDGAPRCTGDAELIRGVRWTAAERVQVSANVSSILFDPTRGTNTPTATLKLSTPDGRSLHQVVNLLGRTRSCSPDGRTTGYKQC